MMHSPTCNNKKFILLIIFQKFPFILILFSMINNGIISNKKPMENGVISTFDINRFTSLFIHKFQPFHIVSIFTILYTVQELSK